jgi:hypothetical protein
MIIKVFTSESASLTPDQLQLKKYRAQLRKIKQEIKTYKAAGRNVDLLKNQEDRLETIIQRLRDKSKGVATPGSFTPAQKAAMMKNRLAASRKK